MEKTKSNILPRVCVLKMTSSEGGGVKQAVKPCAEDQCQGAAALSSVPLMSSSFKV